MIPLLALREYLKVDDDVTADDVLITEMETSAVTYMENETGLYLGPIVLLTEIRSGNGWAPIRLRADPIVDEDYDYGPLQLELRSFPAGDWGALVVGTGYEVAAGGVLYPLAYWTPGSRTLRATYWGGYDEGEGPADIQQAVRELVTRMYQHRSPVVTGSIVAELPFSVPEIIRANKIVVV